MQARDAAEARALGNAGERPVRRLEQGLGPVATATGLTAGIDLALRITDRFAGRALAQKVADYEEWSGKAWAL